MHGSGKFYFPDGSKVEGVHKNGQPWNAIMYDKEGKVIKKYLKGKIK
jgi:antitoxin component YwqK of YwqJK toxin-antitoxin module